MPKSIVERLYHWSWASDERDQRADLMHAAADRIQRMEAAGNALAAALDRHQMACGIHYEAHALVAAWQEVISDE